MKIWVCVAINSYKVINMEYFKCESVRLCRFLYSFGFDKESRFDENGNKYWVFERSQDLQKSLDFFFGMRRKLKREVL